MLTVLLLTAAASLAQPPAAPADLAPLPTLTLTSDDTRVDHSCRIEIGAGKVIADANNDGVIQVAADGITIEFAEGATLRGCVGDTLPETITGIGIRLDGH